MFDEDVAASDLVDVVCLKQGCAIRVLDHVRQGEVFADLLQAPPTTKRPSSGCNSKTLLVDSLTLSSPSRGAISRNSARWWSGMCATRPESAKRSEAHHLASGFFTSSVSNTKHKQMKQKLSFSRLVILFPSSSQTRHHKTPTRRQHLRLDLSSPSLVSSSFSHPPLRHDKTTRRCRRLEG